MEEKIVEEPYLYLFQFYIQVFSVTFFIFIFQYISLSRPLILTLRLFLLSFT